MPILCGVDIVHIPKTEKILRKDGTMQKFFHTREIKGDSRHLAGVIAAKEAFFKALGKVPDFLAIEVSYHASGKPKITAAPELAKYKSCDVSISHDGDYAIAFAVIHK